jgi:hypothetical protein
MKHNGRDEILQPFKEGNQAMNKARRDGLYLLLLGSLVFLLFGVAFESLSPVGMVDFGVLYFPTRTLLHHADPYSESEVLQTFQSEHANRIWDIPREREFMTRFGYPPPTMAIVAPVAMLPWVPAHILWMALNAACLIAAAFLIFALCARDAPILSGALIGFLLANCQAMMVLGNAAVIAVGLSVIAVWCFLLDRHAVAGVLCLALSLSLKPHIAWMVWCYFLLAGGAYRKRALQTAGVAAVIGLPAVVWVWSAAPHWFSEMRTNLAWFSGPGGPCDPSPASGGSHGMDMLVNLQAVLSFFRDSPHFYQPVTYAICGSLLLIWAWITVRRPPTPANAWIALASVSALSVLPFYHHVHDAKLILLALPATVVLWNEGKRIGRIAMLITVLAFVCTGDLVWTVVFILMRFIHPPTTWLGTEILLVSQAFPAPLAILSLGVFYLWMYARRSTQGDLHEGLREHTNLESQAVS